MKSNHANKYDWSKYMHLVRDLSKSPAEVAKIVRCSRDTIYRLRAKHNLDVPTRDDTPRFDYLSALRSGFLSEKRPLEGLSSYMQGDCDDLPALRVSRGHMGRE